MYFKIIRIKSKIEYNSPLLDLFQTFPQNKYFQYSLRFKKIPLGLKLLYLKSGVSNVYNYYL